MENLSVVEVTAKNDEKLLELVEKLDKERGMEAVFVGGLLLKN